MKIIEAPNLNYAWAELIVEELTRNGVDLFCIAPGSRSAPLVAAAARHPKARTVIHYDERGLAFYALGHVSVTRRPAALICTSGTAAANFFPAIIETSKKKLPLILLTADRPPELRETGAHQTIDQVKLYGNYVRWFVDLPAPDLQISPGMLLTTIDQAVFRAKDPMSGPPGPVHLNCMFREPLAPDKMDFNAPAYLESIDRWLKGDHVYTTYTTGNPRADFSQDQRLLSILNNAARGVIAVGKLGSPEEQQAVLKLSEKLDWPIFPDIVSGLRTLSHPNIIHYYDQVLLSDAFLKKFPVDTVLHLGGRITSKRWYGYIEKLRPVNYISVLSHSLRNDPLHIVSLRVKSRVLDFIETLLPQLTKVFGPTFFQKGGPPEAKVIDGEYLHWLRRASEAAGRVIEEVAAKREFIDEIGAARAISKLMPPEHGLFLSNSMAVREMDMYAVPGGANPIIGGNRGASGIDGVIASACGFARALGASATLLIGDLAFLHDLNSLALLKTLEKPLIITAINNDGGGIFSFLPIAASPAAADIFDRCFGTPHGFEFSHAAQMFGLDYFSPKTMAQFNDAYQQAMKAEKSVIIEIRTDREQNYKLHRDLQNKIKSQIDGLN
ncbi:MAG: 2-succinyl-5-enolpyruvyl-6-hydroxy-3-cyclohexene-1-carboxylic-acid synthase [Candidatus Aminicenantes bacterium]|nr:2-succinyl-5-enolpyruvyl-6-hydroxy-3-cyclohexene-1-carboxylic-acid synthase [Candidatus Aminicenantes bacterium]